MFEACMAWMESMMTLSGDLIQDAKSELRKSQAGNKAEERRSRAVAAEVEFSPVSTTLATPKDEEPLDTEWLSDDACRQERSHLGRQVAEVLEELCGLHDESVSVPEPSCPNAMFYSRTKQSISLQAYVERFVHHLDVSPATYLAAMVYLGRAQKASGELRVNSYNIHRVFLTAVFLGIKYTEDVVYSAGTIARVGGVQSSGEVCALERQMLAQLNFELFIHPSLLQSAFTH
uniref:Cyclin n=1 Tax=Erythrolobus australicus TaxID=1077150 RepID=A0A7S1XJ17_9RHOD|mmetsp:Transcript_356/g.896  ORF Transcript_356/g.896 Transcript_356/m.896 type:complete len:232 (+) Transcript_356:158-853(+)